MFIVNINEGFQVAVIREKDIIIRGYGKEEKTDEKKVRNVNTIPIEKYYFIHKKCVAWNLG